MFPRLLTVITGLVFQATLVELTAAPFLVENGIANAEIVIAENPSRSARLAAAELQTYLEKISGARLPIVFTPDDRVEVHAFVGQSSHTESLGVTAEGLEAGAYRIVSGDDWIVLIGDDTDFVPIEPWAKNNGGITSGQLQAEWEKLAGYHWGVPNAGMYKHRERGLPVDLGLPEGIKLPAEASFDVWGFDERGSYNAVCGFLRNLGVRWYLPGDLGEVVPEAKSIALPVIDQVVAPDFPIRKFNVRWSTASDPTMRWFMRLGIREPYGLMVAHGMHTMTHTESILREHPDWFALYGGKRDNQSGERLNHLCYSNAELFDHTVRWARAQFDIYDYVAVSIMPPDAYIAICQCDLCEGKDDPERGSRGKLSNHVWDFANRVAKEVAKTHPDRHIVCCAYGANTDPPTQIEKLEPNVQVVIVGGRRPRANLPEQQAQVRSLRLAWLEKTDNPLLIFENYPFTDRGWYLPAFTPRTYVQSIGATRGHSQGEDIWLSIGRDFDTEGIGFNHFQVYFTARLYWEAQKDNPDAMLNEYCRLFYGPAAAEMQAFFDYCEPNWQAMESSEETIQTALDLFAAAKSKTAPGSTYARRLGLIDEFLDELRGKAELLSQKRGPVTQLRTVWDVKEAIVIDGKLDEPDWRDCPSSSQGTLRELQTGRRPIFGTTVMAAWDRGGQNLYFGIRCDENPGEKPNIATDEDDDQSIWYGDLVEILLDTDAHRYYQIAVNPAGALVDLDRGADKSAAFRWESQAEVATHVADDHWTVEIRLPITDDENDPLNQVVGRKPSASLPWHFNVCRQRIRDNSNEASAYSPTGTATFHEPMKFAHFYNGHSHAFEVDPTVNDYLVASSAAEQLQRGRKTEEALDAWIALSDRGDLTDFQRSEALSQAAECARTLNNYDRAATLATQIPDTAVRQTVQMENLLGQRNSEALVDTFGALDLTSWPFWQIGAGAHYRGRAHSSLGHGEAAENDLKLALAYTSDPRTRSGILVTLGHNREKNLQDDPSALAAYRQNFENQSRIGGADTYRSVQSAARILSRRGQHEEALATLRRIDLEKVQGSWRDTSWMLLGEIEEAAGRVTQAKAAYETIAEDSKADPRARETAAAALARLQ